jgi:hypothetical protein
VLHLLADAGGGLFTPDGAFQGGAVVVVCGFAATVVKVLVGQIQQERGRGDRLEVSMLDKVLPAVTTCTVAVAAATDVMKAIQQERQAEREAEIRHGRGAL